MSSPATDKGYRAGEPPADGGNSYPAEILSASDARASARSGLLPESATVLCSSRATAEVCGSARPLRVKPKDVDAAAGTLSVLHAKRDRRRTVGFNDGALGVLAAWVERRQALRLTARRPLFCTLEGKPLKSSNVRTLLPRLARKAGIEKRVHPHGLRHAHAASEGKPVNLIQAQLGHASLAMADRCLGAGPRRLPHRADRR